MADEGFRVDGLAELGIRTAGSTDHVLTALDNPSISNWITPHDTMKKILRNDKTHLLITRGALAASVPYLNLILSPAISFPPPTPPAVLLTYSPVLTLT